MRFERWAAASAVLALAFGQLPAASAQEAAGASAPPRVLSDSGSPFGAVAVSNTDAAGVAAPDLGFVSDGTEAKDFDKYYYFHRPDTDFATAFADISECDGYARGLQSGIAYQQAPYAYAGTLAGALGGAIGNLMVAAIFGSAEKRRMRRVNMRTCMAYKGYDRFGLPKSVWEKFNFEEGLSSVSEANRKRFLMQQALVASSAKPNGEVLGL